MEKFRQQNPGMILFHKMKVVLKELKECRVALKIIIKKEMLVSTSILDSSYKETQELIAIVGKSIETANKNKSKLD